MHDHRTTNRRHLIDLVDWRAARSPDQAALYSWDRPGRRCVEERTFGELARRAPAIAAELQARGLRQGDRALLCFNDGLEHLESFLGCAFAGVIAVPVYPARSEADLASLRKIVADVEPSAALGNASSLRRAAACLPHGCARMEPAAVPLDAALDWRPPRLDRSTVAQCQYTSGSTGRPKGILVTHGNLLHNMQVIVRAFAASTGDRYVTWLPPQHDMGFVSLLATLLTASPTVVLSPLTFVRDPASWLQAISVFQARYSGGPNFAYERVARRVTDEQLATLDLGSWRLAFTGAEPVRWKTLERFAERFGPVGFDFKALTPCYGMAETTLMITSTPAGRGPVAVERDGVVRTSCGPVAEGMEILIVDPERLVELPAEEIGEVWVAANESVSPGIWNDRDGSSERFRVRLPGRDGARFLRTGDLGYLAANDELILVGRRKDTLIVNGSNVAAEDVEHTVARQDPRLADPGGAVFAVDSGEAEQVVVMWPLRPADREAEDDLAATIRSAVLNAHQLSVDDVVFVPPGKLPRTRTGKVRRHAAREAYLTATEGRRGG